MATVSELGPGLGIAPTCVALGLPRATYYRRRQPQHAPPARARSPRALSPGEQAAILDVLHEPRFVDLAPAEVYATLLDAGQYLCSLRTMYRLFAAHHEVRARRDQLRHPHYPAPELLARRPNELWSWDITKLLGPAKWTYFYLYVILDLVQPGWCLCRAGSATGCTKQISMGPRVPAKMTVRCYLVCWHEMRLDRSGRPGRWVTKESGDMGNSK